ncbi:MAG: choice-of-anchor L domain-containing protein [Rhodobacteraceae bacterium]|nr:choice-of-anchor L domain-containing protein [Paracoccaceae bacterium]
MATAIELDIDSSANAMDMILALFGSGVTVNSASYSGDPLSSGIYTGADTTSPGVAPGDTGVILSTGYVRDFTNSDGSTNTNQNTDTSTDTTGTNNDLDFNALAGAGTRDASFLEAEFVPTGDYLTIDFVISSEEYPEYINSAYNDVIGVWINGVQATVSIGDGSASVGNINGSDTQNLYVDNSNDEFNTEMDGFTITLTFVAPVNPGVVNTLKIGVADVSDSIYDTNLLIAGGSIQTAIVAQDDSVSMNINGTQTVDVLANDSSVGGALTVTHINGILVVAGDTITLGTGQQITLNANGTFTIVADSDDETVYFNYAIEDSLSNTDTALVEIVQIACFGKGTMIRTEFGDQSIETLEPGQLVMTRDNGLQPIRWVGRRTVTTEDTLAPIRFAKGTFGATSDLWLSPQHRVLISDVWSELLFGESEVLVKAKDLINDQTIRIDRSKPEITYFHLLMDNHEILLSNGMATESFLPGPETLPDYDAETQKELLRLFPCLASGAGNGFGHTARLTLKSYESSILAQISVDHATTSALELQNLCGDLKQSEARQSGQS